MFDVIIIGAGPVGSYIAGDLAAKQYNILVVEQNKEIGKAKCCTGIVGKECLNAFPICEEATIFESRSATFITPSGKSLRAEKETTQAYIMSRQSFDSNMATVAQERGAQYLLGYRVTDIDLKSDSVQVNIEAKGRQEVLQGKMVVIASGFHSKLPQLLGLAKTRDFVMGAQSEVQAMDISEVEIYIGKDIAPGFFAWLVPVSSGKALAGLLSRHDTGAYLKKFLRQLAERGKITSAEVEIKYGGIPLRTLPKTYGERVIVVGDAAGQVKPTTGGGIYYGLLSAQIAADTIHNALSNNDFSARALKTYDRKWRKRLSKELRYGYYARWLFERFNDRQIDYLMGTIWSKDIHERLLKSKDFSFDRHGSLIVKGLRFLGLKGIFLLVWHLIVSGLLHVPSGRKSR